MRSLFSHGTLMLQSRLICVKASLNQFLWDTQRKKTTNIKSRCKYLKIFANSFSLAHSRYTPTSSLALTTAGNMNEPHAANNIQLISPPHLGNISECIDGCSSNALLVGLQQLEQFEADSHPLTSRDEFRSTGRKKGRLDRHNICNGWSHVSLLVPNQGSIWVF